MFDKRLYDAKFHKEYDKLHKNRIDDYQKDYRLRKKEQRNQHGRDYSRDKRITIKTEVLTHYGNGICACRRCGFSDIRALTIDHIGGGVDYSKGHKHQGGLRFYVKLKKANFPKGYRTWCMNCQVIDRVKRDRRRRKRPRISTSSV